MSMLCGLLALGLGLVVSAGYDLMIRDGDAWRDLAIVAVAIVLALGLGAATLRRRSD